MSPRGTCDHIGERKSVDLSAGTIHYSELGEGEPLVFVHGFGANGLLWSETAAALAGAHRCILPDWPMGSHSEAMREGADLAPPGMAALISEFLAALDLEGVTIVGNDSGGAVSQILVTEHPDRIGRLVLTNCDCFEKFPPGHFKAVGKSLKLPGAAKAMAEGMRIKANRHSPLVYGALTAGPIDDDLTIAWTRPQITDAGIRRDGVAFFSAADASMTLAAAEKLPSLSIPALLVWGDADKFFTVGDAQRLEGLIPDCRLVVIPGGKTFVPLDDPGAVARAISEFISERPATVASAA